MQIFNVNTVNDIVDATDDFLSLREAVNAAAQIPGQDTINLNNSIFLTSPLFLNTGNDLNINGGGRFTGVDGNHQTSLFVINGAEVRFDSLSLTEGTAQGGLGLRGAGGGLGAGGALFINSGNVTLENVWLTNNQAIGGNAAIGRGDGGRGGETFTNTTGEDGQNGFPGGIGGVFNRFSNEDLALLGIGSPGAAGSGGNGGEGARFGFQANNGEPGSDGSSGDFGSGGGSGGGGGGGGGTAGGGGNGANAGDGGNGGFGAGGGSGGGGGGATDAFNDTILAGIGGRAGSGGAFAGGAEAGEDGERNPRAAGAGGVGGIGGGGAGLGGAVFIRNGSLTLLESVSFENNSAIGGTGFENGQGKGGAIFIQEGTDAELLIVGRDFFDNPNIGFSGNTATDAENNTNLDSPNLFTTDNPNTFGIVQFQPPEPQDQNSPLGNIDVGFDSIPTFVDENGDGDLDLFIGANDGTIAVARNEGTAESPNFSEPIVIRDVGNRSTPTFVDIDGDGDQDLFAGDTFGQIHYYRNRGSVNGASFDPPVINPFGIQGGGGLSNPDFVDIDSDGDQDLFVGTASGTTLFFSNTGSRTRPNFVRGDNNPFGLEAVVGSAAPNFVDVGNDGDFDAFVGAADGQTHYFENVGTLTAPNFIERSLSFLNNSLPDVGSNAAPVLVDINADGFLDAFIGENNGTVNFVNGVVEGGDYPVPINLGDGNVILSGFNGVGNSTEFPEIVDELHFFGEGLTAENLQLTQNGENLELSFEGIENTQVTLNNFELEDLENQANGVGNIIFDGQTEIEDSFDVIDADANSTQVEQPNTVTFLNDLDNFVTGFEQSNDVINAQGGNDTIAGLGGDDLIRGGDGNDVLRGDENERSSSSEGGNDTLLGGAGDDLLGGKGGNDQLFGGEGNDSLWGDEGDDLINGGLGNDEMTGGEGADQFVVSALQGTDTITDFEVGIDSLLFESLTPEQLQLTQDGNNVQINLLETDEVLTIVENVQVDDLSGNFV